MVRHADILKDISTLLASFEQWITARVGVGRSDSRIPDASFGTAEEDALRRDFTVNALFYNVNDGKVEDMTGRWDGRLAERG